ncbi:MAG: DUF4835 domain-containing protein [Flavobacteriaceae bacterium]|nr:DUF4835 domain-containing protein [Flavobacteriaceae bacterium]|tara:strand:- start:205 stop:1092 length:888 start_codon:yes stop_codon:yes gene_type:complete
MSLKALFYVFIFSTLSWGQAVRVTLNVNSDLVDQTNINPVKTLKKAAQDFLNNTKWTSSRESNAAEIDIEMLLTISSFNNNSFAASLQVQSGRMVYNTNYNSPLVNFFDESFGFTYQEFQPFYFDVNRYNNNLISVLSYYINLVIGMEMDSFSPLGGTSYFERARTIANAALASNAQGWQANQAQNGRYDIIGALSSTAFNDFRYLVYNYHRKGLDTMTDTPKEAKEAIAAQLITLENLMLRQPNAYLIQAFFDAKAEEISQLFSDGPGVETKALLRFLNRFVPSMSGYWSSITS